MEKTKYTGVFYRLNDDNTKTFYIKYTINRKQKLEKIGTNTEGVNAVFASKIRAKRTSIDRLKEDAPFSNHDKSMTLNEAFELHYEYSRYNTRDYLTNKKRYEKHLKEILGDFELRRIDVNVLESFKKSMMKKINPKTKESYAPASINHLLDLVRGIFNYIIKQKNLTIENPALGTKVKRLKLDNKRERYLEVEEIKALFDEIEVSYKARYKHKEPYYKIKTFVMLSLSTGARLDSICNIRKQDINFKQKTILIKNFKKQNTYTGYLHPKYEEFIKDRCMSLKGSDFLVSGGTSVYNQSNLSYQLKPILDKLFNIGISPTDSKNRVVIHTFRHTFASLLAINGTPLYTIMKLMDHEDISQTIRYAKLSPDNGSLNVFSLDL